MIFIPVLRSSALLLASLSAAAPGFAQAAAPLTYEVASIKPDKSGSGNTSINTSNDRFLATNITLKVLLQNAYKLQTDSLISGLPGWANDAHFDIEAKMDAETAAALKALTGEERFERHREMMQALLIERFGLKIHHETRELPMYSLVIAKGGSKLKEADPNGKSNGSMMINNQKMTVTGIPISSLIGNLSSQTHRLVEDKTGLTGKYTFELTWSRDEVADSPDAQAPSLFTALQEQLGLKLEAGKSPVDTIVVDRVEQPSEN